MTLPMDHWPGAGPVVVLLHAGVADRRSWRAVGERLAAEGRAVVAYDRRGFGEAADAPTDDGFTHLADLEDVLDTVADGPAWLVGCSMGGEVVLDAALAMPERLAGAVLLAPSVSGAAEPDPDALDAATRAIIVQLEAAESLDAANRLETWLWLDGPDGPEGRVGGEVRDLALAMNAIALASPAEEDAGASGLDAWPRLEEVTLPVHVGWGALDVPFMVEQSRAVAARVPGAHGVELPGTAHLPMLDAPDATAGIIRAALP